MKEILETRLVQTDLMSLRQGTFNMNTGLQLLRWKRCNLSPTVLERGNASDDV